MKDAARYYFKYGILTTTVWVALDALGLMPDNPYGSWLQELTTIWLTGIPITATRHLFFKNLPDLPGFGPPPKPRPRPKHSRVGTIMILAIFTAVMLGILRLEAVGF
ncbi:MAG: hypothetical protein OXH93_15635 [Caldilineaceae bacterium]|nr:hypothetical protein [Caldilineaceae bacterium]MDE0310759.1 hypothetical protein [Caldilineaceae bacterium]MDE0463848.1 hypothetical protein [Caldilineaceae bacterium]